MTQTNPLQADAVVEQRHRDRSAVHHGWTCYQNAALFASSGDMALVDNTAHLLAAFERDYLAIPLQGVEDVRALLAALWATTTEEARKAYADQYGAILAALRPTPSANEIIERCAKVAREDRDRFERNRDMWKGQCERQAEALTAAHDLANRRHGLLLTAEQALEAAQAKVGRYEAARSLLNRFLMSLTGGGKNRENVLSIDHDALVALVKDARKALAEGGGS